MDKKFDWQTYINNYEDLQKAGINNKEKAWKHWIEYGKSEGRTFINKQNDVSITQTNTLTINNFDWETYIRNYEDLRKAGIITRDKAWKHWIEYGKSEGRKHMNIKIDNNMDIKIDNNTNIIELNDIIRQNKIAVISANFGGYDDKPTDLSKIKNYKNFDWYYITDNKNIKNSCWKICFNYMYHINNIKNFHNNDTNRMYSKFYKTQIINIDLFRKYEYIIWIDASFVITNNNFIDDINNLITKNLNENFFIFEHSERTNIKDEYIESIKNIKKYSNQDLHKQITDYYNKNYKDGLYENGFFIYKINSIINNVMNEWWNEIQEYSYQCQISLAYVLPNNNINPYLLNEPDFVKGKIQGNGSIWNNNLIGYVRNHIK